MQITVVLGVLIVTMIVVSAGVFGDLSYKDALKLLEEIDEKRGFGEGDDAKRGTNCISNGKVCTGDWTCCSDNCNRKYKKILGVKVFKGWYCKA